MVDTKNLRQEQQIFCHTIKGDRDETTNRIINRARRERLFNVASESEITRAGAATAKLSGGHGLRHSGSNQVLRVTAAWDLDNDGAALVGFRRIDYVQANCSGGVCKHVVANPNPVGDPQPVELMSGEAASMDITPMPGSSGVRAVVVSNRRNVRVTAQIINTSAGEVTSHIIMANTEGNF